MSAALLSSLSEEMKDRVTRFKASHHTLLSYSSTIVFDHVPVFSTTVTFHSCSLKPSPLLSHFEKCVSSAVLTESEFMSLCMSCQCNLFQQLPSPLPAK